MVDCVAVGRLEGRRSGNPPSLGFFSIGPTTSAMEVRVSIRFTGCRERRPGFERLVDWGIRLGPATGTAARAVVVEWEIFPLAADSSSAGAVTVSAACEAGSDLTRLGCDETGFAIRFAPRGGALPVRDICSFASCLAIHEMVGFNADPSRAGVDDFQVVEGVFGGNRPVEPGGAETFNLDMLDIARRGVGMTVLGVAGGTVTPLTVD